MLRRDTLWVADHHLLQTHTTALRDLLDGPEGKALKLVGFSRRTPGRISARPIASSSRCSTAAWRVYRFSPGINEAETWTQDGQGWTTCYFNRYPDLTTACTLFGGVDEEGGYVFSSADAAIQAAKSLGEELKLPPDIGERKVTLKAHKDGRLVVEIERTKEDKDKPLEGWDDKKGRYVKIFKVKTAPKEDDELDFNEFDNLIRAVETAAVEHAGWLMKKKEKEWVRHPAANVKMVLQSLNTPRTRPRPSWARPSRGWRLVNLPFREEYPGGRQWNLDAAQFKFKPAELADDEVPTIPTGT